MLLEDYLRMAVLHLSTKFRGNIFIWSGYIDIFPVSKFNMAAATILDCHDNLVNLARSAMIAVCFFSSVPNLVQVSRTIAENDPHFFLDVQLMTSCESTSGSVFGHMGISMWSCSIFVPNFVQIGLPSCNTEILAFYDITNGRCPPSWMCWKVMGLPTV